MQEEFWSNARLDVRVVGPDGSQQQFLDQPYALVGTDPRCDIVLPDTRLPARCYAVLLTEDGLLGVSLVRRSIARFRRVDGERGIRLGRFRVCFRVAAPTALSDQAVDRTGEVDTAGLPAYLCWESANRKRYAPVKLGRPLLFGRRSPSRIWLESRSVSAVHGMVYRHGRALWVIDLASTNGTHVGDHPVRQAMLEAGESFEVGGIRVLYTQTAKRAAATTDGGVPSASDDSTVSESTAALTAERDALRADVDRLHAQVDELQQQLLAAHAQLEQFEADRLEWIAAEQRRLDETAQWNWLCQEQQAHLTRRQQELDAAEQQHAANVMYWRREWARQTEEIAARCESLDRSESLLGAEWKSLERARDELARRTAEWAARLEQLTDACHAADRRHEEQLSQLQRDAEQLLVRRIRLQRQFERREQDLKQRQHELEQWHVALNEQLEELARQQVELTERELQLNQRGDALNGPAPTEPENTSRNGRPRKPRSIPLPPGVPGEETHPSAVAAGSSADARRDAPVELANPLLESADFTELLSEFLIEEDDENDSA